MKKIFILWMLVCFAMICSCRKQDSAVEQQLGQQKAELDAREKALDERLNALDEKVSQLDQRVRALVSQEKAIAEAQTVPPDVQSQDVTQLKALMSDPSRLNSARAEKDRLTQERHAQRGCAGKITNPKAAQVEDNRHGCTAHGRELAKSIPYAAITPGATGVSAGNHDSRLAMKALFVLFCLAV